MKLLSPILLGLGLLSAAMASDNANNLRANTSARQLSTDSSGSGGGTWMWYLMLNGLNAIGDHHGGPHSCVIKCEPRCCAAPHAGPGCSCHSGSDSSGGGDGGGGDDDGDGGDDGTDGCGDCGQPTSESSSAVDGSYSGNGYNYEDNENTSTEEQYLEYSEYNEGSGYANQINSGKSFNVWPFLIVALVVGIGAAALIAKKRKQTANGCTDTLAKSVKRRMQYFQGGSSASVSLSQNGYDNES